MLNHPELIVFDVDGVLVDVRNTFHRCTIETVRHYTGRRVTRDQIHHWKNRSGFNDDWRLTTAWIRTLGRRVPYEDVKRTYMQLYWGKNGDGYVRGERWLLPRAELARLARRAELTLFTGRTRQELAHTLDRFGLERFFRRIVTMDDVTRTKPHPQGLLRILGKRDPGTALYLGDNVDDAIAARRASVPFVGVLPRGGAARRVRLARLREEGALAVLHSVKELAALLR